MCKSEDSQLQGYSEETVLELQGAAGREGLPGAEGQQGGIDPSGPLCIVHCLCLGSHHSTGALLPSPALGATARKASRGKHRGKQYLPHFPLFEEHVTLQLKHFQSP